MALEPLIQDPPKKMMEDIEQMVCNGTWQKEVESFKASAESEIEKECHLLLLGRGGSGKTAMEKLLIHGKSIGDPGPIIGTTKHLEHKKVVKGGTTYHIHDTRGIGDSTTNEKELEKDLQEFYAGHQDKCMVILCIRMNDRITDNGNQQCLKVCNSLGPDVWNNVIVAVTHSEIPLEMRKDDNLPEKLEELKKIWKYEVQEQARYFEIKTEVPVCFTSHTEAEQPIEKNWYRNLLETLLNKAIESNSCCQYVFNCLYEALSEEITAITDTTTSEDGLTPCEGPLQNIGNDEELKIIDNQRITFSDGVKAITGGGMIGAVGGAYIGQGITLTKLLMTAGPTLGAHEGAKAIEAGAQVGAAAGVGVGASVAALLFVWLWMKRRNQKSKKD